jgi:hypothetical protein
MRCSLQSARRRPCARASRPPAGIPGRRDDPAALDCGRGTASTILVRHRDHGRAAARCAAAASARDRREAEAALDIPWNKLTPRQAELLERLEVADSYRCRRFA